MNRKEFHAMTGEYPEDVLGMDWEMIIQDWVHNGAEKEGDENE